MTVALRMQEAVGYLAAVASRPELETISHKLLSVHFDLGTKIAALTKKGKKSETSVKSHPAKSIKNDSTNH